MSEYTKGKWELMPHSFEDKGSLWIYCREHYTTIATTPGDTNPKGREESKANAKIIVSAVNACQKVNPENPKAVAESIPAMYEALKAISQIAPKSLLEACAYQGPPPKSWVKETAPYFDGYNKALLEIKAKVKQVLSQIEGG